MCSEPRKNLSLSEWIEESDNSLSRRKDKRLKIWQIRNHTQCSVVGTCLSHGDLLQVLKRCKLKADPSVTPYELHGHFVEHTMKDGPIARALQKMLDKRYAGILRLVGRTDDHKELVDLWQREYTAGRVAGAYWAFQTYAHIPEALHVRIFGEVHMLSHVLGRTVHSTAERASELEARTSDLEAKLMRQSKRQTRALAGRDQHIRSLQDKLLAKSSAKKSPQPSFEQRERVLKASAVTLERRQRALSAARERAKRSETRVAELEKEAEMLRALVDRLTAREVSSTYTGEDCPGALACRLDLPEGETLKVLYLGGRTGTVAKLRNIAETAAAEFLHHDGGKQEAFARIEGLVSRSHVVFCPVDCVSHRACLFAKDQCRRQQKAFVPLRSSGGMTFARALEQIKV
ncbi:MAG: DUF2325 domain-containing protein [Hyphomicrobiaceae bacterium]